MSQTNNTKKSIKFFARLNSKSKKNNIDPEQKKKNKKRRNWIIGLSVFGVSALAIGLAIGLTIPKFVKLQPSLEAGEPVLYVQKADKSKVPLTVGEVEKVAKSFFNETDGELANTKREIIFYLYQQEYEASLVFQKAWDSSRKSGEASRSFKIDSLEEVKEKQLKTVNDDKRRFQTTFGVNNWEAEWLKELATDKYGKSATEEQAAEFLTLGAVKSTAFARWLPVMDTAFTKYDVEQRVVSEDIYKTNKDGTRGEIYLAKGDRVFKNIINTKNTTTNPLEINGFLPEVEGHEVLDTTKVTTFITKSFIDEYRNPQKLIEEYLNKISPVYNVSELIINAKPNETNTKEAWEISKKDVIDLLIYKITNFNNTNKTIEVKQTIELINDFKGNFGITTEEHENDTYLLNAINSSNNTNYLGGKPLRNIYDIFKDEDIQYANSFLKELFQPKDLTTNFFGDLLTKLRTALFGDNADEFLPNSSSLTNKTPFEIQELNTNIQKQINALNDTNFKNLVGDVFKNLFASDTNDFRVQTRYKIADDKWIALSSKGIHYMLVQNITNVNEFNKLVAKDAQLEANKIFDSKQKATTDLASIFSFYNDENQVFASMIKDVEVQNYVREKLKPNSTEAEWQKLLNSLLQTATKIQVSYFVDKATENQKKVETYIDTVIDNKLNSDYNFNTAIMDYAIKGSASGLSAKAEIYNTIKGRGKVNGQ
ncbi:hypothetical protein NV226_00075 [Mycoplasma iguanae]|uniref:Membrane protein P80 n=1 Tax=Mycoplasma iguanae TaxID=292461 RepID=A0ABY5R8U6_9MOLU|nr:hypothetical protein [Mycoplasma iguanae]UVD81706.1 hypothetical protein NV226_00075 [Mycoplasma iguanae]